MNGTSARQPDYYSDVHNIYNLVEVTPGLPKPFTGPDRAAFHFTSIAHPEDARVAVLTAIVILEDAFKVTFAPARVTQSGSTRRRVFEALMPGGLTVALVAMAEHFEDQDTLETAGELVAA